MNAPVDPALLAKASLDDKYTLPGGRVFLTGTQALIRLMMLQRERDARAGLNTAGFVSGYRGSPLGGLATGRSQAGSGPNESARNSMNARVLADRWRRCGYTA